MVDLRRRRSVSSAFLLDLLRRQLDELLPGGRRPLSVVDLGGGTGGLAVTLAELGHSVLVIDPSPDALASLERRTAEAGLIGRLQGVQGDAADLERIVGAGRTDVVVCHRVLEVVDDPAAALAAVASALRPGGALSLLVAQRQSSVLAQALAGHLAAARRTYTDPGRFDYEDVVDLVRGAGFTVVDSDGIGAISDHVPEPLIEGEPGGYADLTALEAAISRDPAFRAIAPAVHLFAQTASTLT